MKRDLDFIRDILLQIEAGRRQFSTISSVRAANLGLPPDETLSEEDALKLREHLHLLEQNGLIEVEFRSLGGQVNVRGLTWQGHDFVDSVKDDEIWNKTKKGVQSAGGFTFELIKDLAKGYVKKMIEEKTGVKL
ncbi:DUF2513 domain-containing protein [Phreatobacter sp. HK31-P]